MELGGLMSEPQQGLSPPGLTWAALTILRVGSPCDVSPQDLARLFLWVLREYDEVEPIILSGKSQFTPP